MKDNGTFSCAVKNPPDVHHNIPATELTVTERGKLTATNLVLQWVLWDFCGGLWRDQ